MRYPASSGILAGRTRNLDQSETRSLSGTPTAAAKAKADERRQSVCPFSITDMRAIDRPDAYATWNCVMPAASRAALSRWPKRCRDISDSDCFFGAARFLGFADIANHTSERCVSGNTLVRRGKQDIGDERWSAIRGDSDRVIHSLSSSSLRFLNSGRRNYLIKGSYSTLAARKRGRLCEETGDLLRANGVRAASKRGDGPNPLISGGRQRVWLRVNGGLRGLTRILSQR
jgi:hypothetical protein